MSRAMRISLGPYPNNFLAQLVFDSASAGAAAAALA
jgi:hypothetical protein